MDEIWCGKVVKPILQHGAWNESIVFYAGCCIKGMQHTAIGAYIDHGRAVALRCSKSFVSARARKGSAAEQTRCRAPHMHRLRMNDGAQHTRALAQGAAGLLSSAHATQVIDALLARSRVGSPRRDERAGLQWRVAPGKRRVAVGIAKVDKNAPISRGRQNCTGTPTLGANGASRGVELQGNQVTLKRGRHVDGLENGGAHLQPRRVCR
ncbi:MAG: hypothetical protein DDT26_02163 [Dehalococcoidia bacterium]|nr:hypothetical protein [Chloroflexota bacterium]